MKIPIIDIGNSKGIILGKTLLERYEFGDNLEVIMKHDHIVLKSAGVPRQGWDEAFMKMHEMGEDRLLDDDVLDDDIIEEWK